MCRSLRPSHDEVSALGDEESELAQDPAYGIDARPVPKLGPAGIDERTAPLEIRLKL